MTDDRLTRLQISADSLLFALAEAAGVEANDLLAGVEEEYLDTLDEGGNYGMEVWTVFKAEAEDGQLYYAHLPGRLDDLIVRVVRDHSAHLEGE